MTSFHSYKTQFNDVFPTNKIYVNETSTYKTQVSNVFHLRNTGQ